MPDEWFRNAFGEDYLELYYHRDEREADAFVGAILDYYPPPPGGLVLDVACGSGRHALNVARRGYRVIGVDLSHPMLSRAIGSRGSECALFVQADKRALPFGSGPGPADMVLNLFTSFGYFGREEENEGAFRGMADALRPGGVLVLDFMNRDHVIEHLVPEDEQYREGLRIRQRRAITDDGGRIEKQITLVYADDSSRDLVESVRLYRPEELEEMAGSCGLETVARWGDYQAAPHRPFSPRYVLIARRPA
jgi:SAM-dependent methyltransferase